MLSCFINFIFNSFAISYRMYFVVTERKKNKEKKYIIRIDNKLSNVSLNNH